MSTEKKTLRCAVYTRKSTDRGLDQQFTSLDAQRDACLAYIASQRIEGWVPIETHYDDPAFSGGNLDRPALQRLLADIAMGLVDIVVVYKIDRLTRSLVDFAKLIEHFDQHNASFVAITQQFSTTNSMGRLTLNILLSFAQFEREVSGERIRDKIRASKQKGLWMGGIPPLGYDVKDRCLVVNAAEATLIRRVFTHVADGGSVTQLLYVLQREGVTSKSWTTQQGHHKSGRLIDKGMIYRWLHNRTYLGELSHKGEWYPGKHKAIIDQTLWDSAHRCLSQHNHRRTSTDEASSDAPFLLKGLLVTEDGRALTPYSTIRKKSGRRYRYYVSTVAIKEGDQHVALPRLPAAELESVVIQPIRYLLRTEPVINRIVDAMNAMNDAVDEAHITVAMCRMERIWEQLFPHEQARILQLLIEKIVVTPSAIDIRLQPNGIEQLAWEVTDTANAPIKETSL